MNYILFDGNAHDSLLPFTFTRPVAEIRIGILTVREKWSWLLGHSCSCHTVPYLLEKFPFTVKALNVFVNASVLPDRELSQAVADLGAGECLRRGKELLALCLSAEDARNFSPDLLPAGTRIREWEGEVLQIRFPEDIFRLNAEALARDFKLLTEGRKSAPVSATNNIAGDQLFVEEGVEMECANINTKTGPVYIGKNVRIMEGLNLRGPAAICDHVVIKMGAKLYGPSTIGPKSVVGGEVKQSVIFGHSNKSHEGYLGNSVVGEWCNFGADTNCSNMKNNYKPVKLWNYQTGSMRSTGLQYCGLMMGDFSRTGINTMLNTGTTIGMSAHVFDSGFLPTFVPDFSWGGAGGLQSYRLEKALETAALIKEQKEVRFTEADRIVFKAIFNLTERFRK